MTATGVGARLRSVRRAYGRDGEIEALSCIDLDIEQGSVTAVLGPSGCGKSTLLRVVAGLERPDDGQVELGGRLVSGPGVHLPAEKRHIGLVPQEGALFPHLDVSGNIGYGLSRLDRRARARRVGELLDLIGLAGYERRRPHQLSGGQQQRVALARALATGPGIVLLDEPFSALDTALRVSLRNELIAMLRATGTTAVLVTHDQTEALSTADTVAVMRSGRIVQHTTPVELYRHPADLWTASVVGDAVVLPGQLTPSGTAVCALGELAAAPSPTTVAGPVDVLLRPEQVVPGPPEHTGAVAGGVVTAAVRGRVVATSFEGALIVVKLEVDGVPITARWPSSTTAVAVGDVFDLAVSGPAVVFAANPRDQPARSGCWPNSG